MGRFSDRSQEKALSRMDPPPITGRGVKDRDRKTDYASAARNRRTRGDVGGAIHIRVKEKSPLRAASKIALAR